MNYKYALPIPFFVLDFPQHNEIKEKALQLIADDPKVFASENNSYWPREKEERPYWDFLWPHFNDILKPVCASLKIPYKVYNYWYQQYEPEGEHTWHTHENVQWACVYYLELPDGAPVTKFKSFMEDSEFEIPNVIEGKILMFPAVFVHSSPKNMSGKRKTIVGFNLVSVW